MIEKVDHHPVSLIKKVIVEDKEAIKGAKREVINQWEIRKEKVIMIKENLDLLIEKDDLLYRKSLRGTKRGKEILKILQSIKFRIL